RTRAGDGEHAAPRGDVLDRDSVGRRVRLDPSEVVRLGRSGADDVEPVFADACHRRVALDAAALVAHGRQGDAPGVRAELVRAQPVQQRFGSRTGDLELREAALIEDPDRRPDGAALTSHDVVPWRRPERVLRLAADRVVIEPQRALPAEALPEDGPSLLEKI